MLRHAFPLLSPSRYTPLLPKRPFRIPSHRYSSPSSTPSFSPSSISLSSRFLSSSSPPPPPPSPPPTPPSNDDRDPSKSLHVKKQQLKELQAKGQQRLQSGLTTLKERSAQLKSTITKHENIKTIPNLLTLSRIASCPVLAWSIINGNFELATGLLVYAGVTDWVDGYVARTYNMGSVLGTVLDPLADKLLMTTLVVALTTRGLLPTPLAVLILGRDVIFIIAAFYLRWSTLHPPKTWSRYWDVTSPSVEFHPNMISKINTALQLLLMGTLTVSPLIPYDIASFLLGFQYTVGFTTLWSGISYAFSKTAIRRL